MVAGQKTGDQWKESHLVLRGAVQVKRGFCNESHCSSCLSANESRISGSVRQSLALFGFILRFRCGNVVFLGCSCCGHNKQFKFARERAGTKIATLFRPLNWALAIFKDEKYCMIFRLDEKFIRRTRLKIAVIGIALIAVGAAFLYSMVLEENWKLLFGVFFVYLGFRKIKELKYWNANNKKISLEINPKFISVSDFNEARSLKVENVTKAVLQPIHGKIKSIVIHTSGGGITKLEGFEAMDKIADKLKELLGESNVKIAKLFHR